eukprot:6105546-Pleurochrysis_carterae.AAC.1
MRAGARIDIVANTAACCSNVDSAWNSPMSRRSALPLILLLHRIRVSPSSKQCIRICGATLEADSVEMPLKRWRA